MDSYVGINLIIPSSNRTRDTTNSVRLRVTVVYHLNIQNRKKLLLCYPQSIYIKLHAYVALIQVMTNPKLSDLTKLKKLIFLSYLSNLIGKLGFLYLFRFIFVNTHALVVKSNNFFMIWCTYAKSFSLYLCPWMFSYILLIYFKFINSPTSIQYQWVE